MDRLKIRLKELEQRSSVLEADRLLERRMVYGMSPEIALKAGPVENELKSLARSYSYKDVLKYHNIKNHEVLEKLLQALALQIGSEVSYNELAGLLGVDKNTVSAYIQILEKAFIIFRLGPFSRNIRNELKKLRKIYFYDTGLRNALINNLNPLELRQDTGGFWENFIITERRKYLANNGLDRQGYYWRTQQMQEIDYLETQGDALETFEIKWKKIKAKPPRIFAEAYPKAFFHSVSRHNYRSFLCAAAETGEKKRKQ